jgi:hypothetical protein
VLAYDFAVSCFYTHFKVLNVDLRIVMIRNNLNTTFSNGSLGSRIDEERSEMR